ASADAEESIEFSARQLAPVIPNPRKVLCTGLNFREHIVEMGHPVPDHPTLFAKFATALTTPYGNVRVPRAMAQKLDYEGELAIVMGHGGQIAGYAVINDFSQRDWQYRTQQWLQGKNLDESSALGPWLTMATDEKGQAFDPWAEGAMLRTWVNGELRQEHSLADLVFKPQELVEYVENFATLEAGDIIALGTPAGVGHGMTPRSEEHTSELQSRFDLVCRLLIEKKKKKTLKLANRQSTMNWSPTTVIMHITWSVAQNKGC